MRPTLEDEWDLEPWDDDPDGVDAHYIRESSEPEIDDEGREIWLYVYSPRSWYDDPAGSARHRLDVRSSAHERTEAGESHPKAEFIGGRLRRSQQRENAVTLLGAAWQTGHVIDDRDADASRLAAEALAQDDPTGWFERLYAEAAAGDAIVPWDRDEPNPLLVDWTERRRLDGAGRRAMVVGCGLGRDAEHVAALGFHTTAFDISQTAVRGARERFPESTVDYVVADLLDPPTGWAGVFDLVVESITVQSMPLSVRADAITHIGQMVARGGELVVISGIREEGEHVDGPPWPLTRAEVDSFAVGGLRATHIEQVSRPDAPDAQRWRAAFRRA